MGSGSKIIHTLLCGHGLSSDCVCLCVFVIFFLCVWESVFWRNRMGFFWSWGESQWVIAENVSEGVFCRHVLSCLSPAACLCQNYDIPKAVTSASSPCHTVVLRVWLRPDHRGLLHQNLHRGREGDPIRQYVCAVHVLTLCVCVVSEWTITLKSPYETYFNN